MHLKEGFGSPFPPFGLSDEGCKVKTESPVFYWYLSAGIRLVKIEAVPSSILNTSFLCFWIADVLNYKVLSNQSSWKMMRTWKKSLKGTLQNSFDWPLIPTNARSYRVSRKSILYLWLLLPGCLLLFLCFFRGCSSLFSGEFHLFWYLTRER